jgi:cyclopropane fatty-acyl-phospholipid synthase-like methyltransferase
LNALTRDDLAAFDELHSGGRDATRALAERTVQAGFRAGMRVLDVGSGIGGPARTLAAEFGGVVVGLDLTESRSVTVARWQCRSLMAALTCSGVRTRS